MSRPVERFRKIIRVLPTCVCSYTFTEIVLKNGKVIVNSTSSIHPSMKQLRIQRGTSSENGISCHLHSKIWSFHRRTRLLSNFELGYRSRGSFASLDDPISSFNRNFGSRKIVQYFRTRSLNGSLFLTTRNFTDNEWINRSVKEARRKKLISTPEERDKPRSPR